MHKILLLLLPALLAFATANAQKKGKFFKESDPVCNLWQLEVAPIEYNDEEDYSDEEAYADEESGWDGPLLFAGMGQQFFFLIPDGSEKSMMAIFYDEEMGGFACPTYFQASYDKDYIYCKIGESCALDIPESEKFVALKYAYDAVTDKLTLFVDDKPYVFVKWE